MIYFTFQAMKNGHKLDEDENWATREEIREKFNEIKQSRFYFNIYKYIFITVSLKIEIIIKIVYFIFA